MKNQKAIKVQIICHPYSIDNSIVLDNKWQSSTIDVGTFTNDEKMWINAYTATLIKLKELIFFTHEKLQNEYTCTNNNLKMTIKLDLVREIDQTDINRIYSYMLYLEDVYKQLFYSFSLNQDIIKNCVYPGMLIFDNSELDLTDQDTTIQDSWFSNIAKYFY
jgi:hypothetical protein